MPALSADILAAVLDALRTHRNARRAAHLVGVNPATAWRIAKKYGITLIPLAEHMKARRADPAFIAKQAPAARKGASRWLKAQHAKPKFHKKAIAAARRNLKRLNRDPAFRLASSERLKRLYDDPVFCAKQAAAARAARHRAKAKLPKKTIKAALRDLRHVNRDPAFRQASSEPSKRLYVHPDLHTKQAAAPREARNRGFAIAPILYLLGLIGVGAGVLFSGYSQILRSSQTMSNTLAAKNDLQGTATTLAATAWLSNDKTLLCPPLVGSNSPQTPSANCSTNASAITVGTSFANATAGNLPANYSSISSAGSPVEVGVFKAGSGVKVLDPWGHYYLYCRWENGIGGSNAIEIISGGADGKIASTCGSTTAGGDNLLVVWSTAVTQNRAAVWQTTTVGSSVTGAQFGATGSQVNIDTSGDVIIPGTLGVAGLTTLNALTASSITNTPISGSTGSFTTLAAGGSGQMTVDSSGDINTSGTLGISGLSTLGQVSAGSSTLTYATVTNNASVGGTLGVTGQSTLGGVTAGTTSVTGFSASSSAYFGSSVTTSTGVVQVGTTVAATGTAATLFAVGKPLGSPPLAPFYIDQYGNVTGGDFTGSFTGNLTGSQSGGSVSATSLSASGATSLTGQLNGSSAVFTGNVQAASFIGTVAIGGGGVTFTGVLPVANGGTAASTAAGALSGLFSAAGTISGMIPGADLVSGSVTATQLSATGVAAGTYSTVTVATDGRVYSGTPYNATVGAITDNSGDSVAVSSSTGIVFTICTSTEGNWTTTGLMVGNSTAAVNTLDVYGAQAIGTGYAGTYTAPANGLIVQGNVGIGTTNPGTNALQVNGTVAATSFSGSGSGLTNIGTASITGVLPIANGGTAASSQTTNGVNYYDGTSITSGTGFVYTGGKVGIGSSSPMTSLDLSQNTDALALPVGNTGQRPTGSSLYPGEIRYNTATPALEAYVNGSWTSLITGTGGLGSGITLGTSASVTNPQKISDITTGLFSSATGAVSVSGSGSEIARFVSGNVGIGTATPAASLDLSQKTDALALPVGTTGQEPASPLNGMIRYNKSIPDLEAYIGGAWTTLTTGGDTASINLGTSAAAPNPASSYSATTGFFSDGANAVATTIGGVEKMRVNATGVGIGTTAPGALLTVGNNLFEVNSSGTVLAGTWQGTSVALGYGGTGGNSAGTGMSNLLGNPSAGNYMIDCTSGTSCTTVAAASAGVTTFSAGTTGFTPSSATSGAITLTGILNIANGGTGSATATAYSVFGNNTGGTAAPAFVTAPVLSGAIETLQTIGTSSTDGIMLYNATAATASVQQWSPRLHFEGQGWKTAATAATKNVDFIEEVQTASGVSAPTGTLAWSAAIGTTVFSPIMALTSGGSLGIGTASPQSLLHVQAGEVQVGSSGASCATANAGAIRYNGGTLYYCDNASTWESIDSSGGADTGEYYIATATATPTSGQGMFGGSTTLGGVLAGYGSTSDVTLENRANTPVFEIPANTTNAEFLGNVGIGTATPATNLSVYNANQSSTLTNFTQALTNAGLNIMSGYTAGDYTPGIFWSTANNNATLPKAGIWTQTSSSGSYLNFGTSNSYTTGITNQAMVIDYNGNVGIGTTAPVSALDVNGDIRAISQITPSTGAGVEISYGGGEGYIQSYNRSSNANEPLYISGSQIYLNAGAAGQGNVGIETAVPNDTLDVGGGVHVEGATYPSSGYGMELVGSSNSSVIQSYNRNTSAWEAFTVNAYSNTLAAQGGYNILTGGNVGIGTATPATNLSVYNANQSATLTNFTQALTNAGLNIMSGYTAGDYTPGIFWSTANNNATLPKAGIWTETSASGSYLNFGTSNSYTTGITNQAMVIDYTGNVGIGTTVPGALLTVGNNLFEVNSSGDVLAGTWEGTQIGVAYGGTNCTSASITCFNNITGYSAAGATGTTSTSLVFSTSPSITTPTFVTSATGPIIYGGTSAGSTLTLDGTSNGSPSNAYVLLNPSGQGNVGIWTTSPAGILDVEGGTATSGAGVAGLVAVAQTAASGNNAGGAISLTSGTGGAGPSGANATGGIGGAITLTSGTGGTCCVGGWSGTVSAGTGGPISLVAGNAGTSLSGGGGNPNGGAISLTGGTGTDKGLGGALTFTAGTGGAGPSGTNATGGTGGGVTISSGTGGTCCVGGWGGTVSAGTGGPISLVAGNAGASLNGGGGNPNGGAISLSGGAGLGSGAGGSITLTAGTPGATGAGGSISFTTGAGGSTSGNSGALIFGTGTYTSGSYGTISFTQGGTTPMFIGATGNVGIGITSPNLNGYANTGGVLTIQNPSGTYEGVLELANRTDADAQAMGVVDFDASTQTSAVSLRTAEIRGILSGSTANNPGSALTFFTRANGGTNDLAERVRIDNGGNVGVGTTNPGALFTVGSNAFEVNSSGTVNTAGNIVATGSVIVGAISTTSVQNIGANYSLVIGDESGGTSLAALNTAHNAYELLDIYGSTVTTHNESDARLKTNVQNLSGAQGLTAIMQLRPVAFNWLDTQQNAMLGPQVGLIAQEVQKVFPGLVSASSPMAAATITLADGTRKVIEKPLTLNYEGFIVPLIKAVQDLKSLFDGDHGDIAKLKADNDDLRALVEKQGKEIEALKKARP